MGDLIGVDFKSKKRLGLIETPLQEGLSIIAQAMKEMPGSGIDGLPWPGMDSANYVAPDDPA